MKAPTTQAVLVNKKVSINDLAGHVQSKDELYEILEVQGKQYSRLIKFVG